MNADKTQLVWLGTRPQLAKLTTTELTLLSALVKPSSAVLNLGVNIDGKFTMADRIAALRQLCLLHPGLICRRQVAAAVGKQRGTRRAAHKDHDRSEGLCRGWPGHFEQPPRRPADFITVQRYICEQT